MRARDLVGNPLDASNINDATVLALLGYYHLNSNRRDVAYLYINVAMHILVVHGIHRAWMIDEDGKRLFWTIYSLDRWLSKLMGRPVLISDDSIKLDLPRDAKGLPPPKGLCAHIHLSRISHYITSHVYEECHSGAGPSSMITCIQTALVMLREWRQSLPDLLQLTEDNFSQDRAVYDLRMHHNQV
jgi:Fungal specific transcription factor domain